MRPRLTLARSIALGLGFGRVPVGIADQARPVPAQPPGEGHGLGQAFVCGIVADPGTRRPGLVALQDVLGVPGRETDRAGDAIRAVKS